MCTWTDKLTLLAQAPYTPVMSSNSAGDHTLDFLCVCATRLLVRVPIVMPLEYIPLRSDVNGIHTFTHSLTYIQRHCCMNISKECVPLQCIILEIVLGIVELKVLSINLDCDLKGQAEQPLEILHLLLVLV